MANMANEKWLRAMNAIKHISNKPLLAGAFVLQRYSMQNAPVLTGFLRSSHGSRETDDGAQVEVGAEYAHYVEFGTSKMSARSFLRKAGDEHLKEIVAAVEKAAADEIRKAARG